MKGEPFDTTEGKFVPVNVVDMLSYKKAGLHGMKDSRWVTQDKITQYKNLVNLHLRDKAAQNTSLSALEQRYFIRVQNIKENIKYESKKLEEAINGDRQKVYNALASDRSLQLAFGRTRPHVIRDGLSQECFNQRKELDRLKQRGKGRCDIIKYLRLEIAELEDRLRMARNEPLPVEVQAGIITGKVQDAILKKEAAITVNQAYKKMIAIMRKDSIYYEAVLKSVSADLVQQNFCTTDAVYCGQLAMEKKDDRKREVARLELKVQDVTMYHRSYVAEMHKKLNLKMSQLQGLISRDSITNLHPRADNFATEDDKKMTSDIAELEKTFDTLTATLMKVQEDRLAALVQKFGESHDVLENRLNHAQAMHEMMVSNVSDNFEGYKLERDNFKKIISEEKERAKLHQEQYAKRCDMLTRLRSGLQILDQQCKLLETSTRQVRTFSATSNEFGYERVELVEYITVEENVDKLINGLLPKLARLYSMTSTIHLNERELDQAHMELQSLRKNKDFSLTFELPPFANVGLDDTFLEDGHVFNRNDVKKQSDEIVAFARVVESEAMASPSPTSTSKRCF